MNGGNGTPTGALLTLVSDRGVAMSLFLDTDVDLIARGALVDTSSQRDIDRVLMLGVPAVTVEEVLGQLPGSHDWVAGSQFVAELPEASPLEVSIEYVNPDAKFWAGKIRNIRGEETIRFGFQELHSPEVGVIIVTVLGILCGISVLADLLKGCESKAEKACGTGKVKSVKTKKSWAGLASCSMECEFVCRD